MSPLNNSSLVRPTDHSDRKPVVGRVDLEKSEKEGGDVLVISPKHKRYQAKKQRKLRELAKQDSGE
jgi:hypothetical protein